MRNIWVALFIAAGALTVGVANPRAMAQDDGHDREDRQQEQIRAKLAQAPDLADNRIQVVVDDGIAVLEGTVDSQQEKKEATQLAHVEGILGVNNRLAVRGGAGK
jgi:osmotically-inducible protein OsmY